MSLICRSVEEELREMYSSADRFYHDVSHVEALLSLLNKNREHFSDPEAVEAAIWFHDAVYDTHMKDNEMKSAQLAAARLCTPAAAEGRGDRPDAVVCPERIERITAMIEATATHTIHRHRFSGPGAIADAEMFLDMDLSILGASKDEFEFYEVAVRKEYSWVDDEGWRSGRAAVLKSFIAREHIFHSGLFRRMLEEQARSNIESSLRRLGKDGRQ